jgi:hypothetical protein
VNEASQQFAYVDCIYRNEWNTAKVYFCFYRLCIGKVTAIIILRPLVHLSCVFPEGLVIHEYGRIYTYTQLEKLNIDHLLCTKSSLMTYTTKYEIFLQLLFSLFIYLNGRSQ